MSVCACVRACVCAGVRTHPLPPLPHRSVIDRAVQALHLLHHVMTSLARAGVPLHAVLHAGVAGGIGEKALRVLRGTSMTVA